MIFELARGRRVTDGEMKVRWQKKSGWSILQVGRGLQETFQRQRHAVAANGRPVRESDSVRFKPLRTAGGRKGSCTPAIWTIETHGDPNGRAWKISAGLIPLIERLLRCCC